MTTKRKKKCEREGGGEVTEEDTDSEGEACHHTLYSSNIGFKPSQLFLSRSAPATPFNPRASIFGAPNSSPTVPGCKSSSFESQLQKCKTIAAPRTFLSSSSPSSSSSLTRSSVGFDPRDASHPLSISQLTSSHKKPASDTKQKMF